MDKWWPFSGKGQDHPHGHKSTSAPPQKDGVRAASTFASTVLADAQEEAKTQSALLPYDPTVNYARQAGAIFIGRVPLDNRGAWGENPNPAMRINEATRRAVRERLVESLLRGEDPHGLARKLEGLIQDVPGASPLLDRMGRVSVISLTESALAMNMGTLAHLSAAGVKLVKVNEAGGTEQNCAQCKALHGRIWSLGYALSRPLGHPCCGRTFTSAEGFDGTPDEPSPDSPLNNLWMGQQY